MDNFVQDEILLTQISHRNLHLLPLDLPEVSCESFILCVQQSLSVAHLEDLIDSLFLDLLLLMSTAFR